MKSSIFCDITSYSPLKVNRVAEVATCFIQVSRLDCFSTLKMEVTRSSVTSVDFKQATLRYIPENRTLLIGVLALCQYHIDRYRLRCSYLPFECLEVRYKIENCLLVPSLLNDQMSIRAKAVLCRT
jgi:hypothetical protein